MPYLIDFDSIPWESPMEGLRFRAVGEKGRQVRLVEYTADMDPHWCDKGHVGMVLEGTVEIEFPGETLVFESGAGVFIPSGQEHCHKARVISGPVRALFVEEV
jgi:mannose-6-phosphate isomerase-like protein (cupin superfamily)